MASNGEESDNRKSGGSNLGRLQGTATLNIHTHQARRLIYGRQKTDNKPAILGVVSFAKAINQIYIAARQDNPYADLFLVTVEARLGDAMMALRQEAKNLEGRMKQFEGMNLEALNVQIAKSEEPQELPLQFATPYGFQAAYLVSAYDELVRTILTAKHVGLLGRDESEDVIRKTGRTVRGTLDQVRSWKYFAITRDDVRQNTQPAQQAAKLFGPLPAEVLEGSLRGQHAPEIAKRRQKEASDSAGKPAQGDSRAEDAEPAPAAAPTAQAIAS